MSQREKFRLSLRANADIFLVMGTAPYKHRLLDLSESGLSFLSDRKLAPGIKGGVMINFPWLSRLLPLKLKIVRSSSVPRGKESDLGALAAISGAGWEVAGLFEGLGAAEEEMLFSQIRMLDWQRRQRTIPSEFAGSIVTPNSAADLNYQD
jgi:hypothetical protein